MTKLKDRPFVLVGVHIGGLKAEPLKAVMEKQQLPWRSFADAGSAGAGPIAAKWNVTATPTLYVIDEKGVIRYKWVGPPGETALDSALERLIQAAEGR